MRAIETALRRMRETDHPLIEVLDEKTGVARVLSYREVTRCAQALTGLLAEQLAVPRAALPASGPRKVGVVCGNTPAFVIADLALIAARLCEVPVPLAFSPEQAAGLLEDVELCLVDDEGEQRLKEWDLPGNRATVHVSVAALAARDAGPLQLNAPADDWECKVIHTSGTTSRPKGVRIRAHALDALLSSLMDVMPQGAFGRYLSLVPFSLLIEQVTGLYMVILQGGTLVQLPASMPLVGTDASAVAAVMPFVRASRPTALVATPALVDEFASAAEAVSSGSVPEAIFGTVEAPLICCGGAPVHPDVLHRLEALGLPVHEGYGLSENSSVVSWNTPEARRVGTVGRPLPHVTVRTAEDGELLVKSTSLFAGYTRSDPSSLAVDSNGWLRTGDLASIDEDGFIRITGRKKNVIITGTGRNIAPEWVEAQYARLPFVRAVAVVGDGMTALHGLFLVREGTEVAEAREAIKAFGREHLSEVERVAEPCVAVATEDLYQRFFTVTGRPVRTAVQAAISDGMPDIRQGGDHEPR